MPKLTPIKRQDLIRKLKKLGFDGPFIGGRHEFMQKGSLKVTIPNNHSGKDIGINIISLICEHISVEKKVFQNL